MLILFITVYDDIEKQQVHLMSCINFEMFQRGKLFISMCMILNRFYPSGATNPGFTLAVSVSGLISIRVHIFHVCFYQYSYLFLESGMGLCYLQN